jgi:hypothetical protein
MRLRSDQNLATAAVAALLIAVAGCSGARLGGGIAGNHGSGGDSPPCTAVNCGGLTGGIAGNAATGGSGAGGFGGSASTDGGQSCNQLAATYASALTAAFACTPGQPNQCQALVANVPANCPVFLCGQQSYVNDGTAIETARLYWLNAGCGDPPNECIGEDCAPPLGPSVCVPTSGPRVGTCVPLSTVDGGVVAAPDGGVTCDQLAADYVAAVGAAQACTPGASNQCQVVAGKLPTTCPLTGCGDETYVNDATGVDVALGLWLVQCGQPVGCPQIVCKPPAAPGICAANGASDGGTARGTCTAPFGDSEN